MHSSIKYLCCWLFLALSSSVLSHPAADTSTLTSGQALFPYLQYLEDPSGQLDIADEASFNWQALDEEPSFGYTSSVFWFKLVVRHSGQDNLQALLEINYPVLDSIMLYRSSNQLPWTVYKMGDKQPFAEREHINRNFIVPFNLQPNDTQTLVFRVNTSSSMQLPLSFWHAEQFYIQEQNNLLGLGIYYGIMFVMVFYNLFIFFSTREANYLYYVLYTASLALFLASFQGLSFQFLWPNATTWNDNSIVFFLSSAVFFGILFTRSFLELSKSKPFNAFTWVVAALTLLIIFAIGTISYHLLIQMLIALSLFALLSVTVITLIKWRNGLASARLFALAWGTLILGGILMALNKFNIIPLNIVTENSLQIGSILEVTLLSFALADRLNHEKQKRYKLQIMAVEIERQARITQEKALEQERLARTAQAEALAAQKHATEQLEQRVAERTQELEEANQKLELMSITDPLTGIYNRRYFDHALIEEYARAFRQQRPLGVLIVDVDHFKNINDTYGHLIGDEVLKMLAALLKQELRRSTDLAARYGGEEFVVVLPETNQFGSIQVAERIRQAVMQLDLSMHHPELVITISVGVFAQTPDHTSELSWWVKNADDALYQAKETGRNQTVAYSAPSA